LTCFLRRATRYIARIVIEVDFAVFGRSGALTVAIGLVLRIKNRRGFYTLIHIKGGLYEPLGNTTSYTPLSHIPDA
jgi:hypothetical protein